MPRWYFAILKAAVVRTPSPLALPRPLPSSVNTCSRRVDIARYIPIAHLLIPKNTIHAASTGLHKAATPPHFWLTSLLRWFGEVCHLGLTRHQAAQKGIQIPCGLDTPCKPDLTTKEKLELPCGSETPTRPCRPDAPAGVKLPMRE